MAVGKSEASRQAGPHAGLLSAPTTLRVHPCPPTPTYAYSSIFGPSLSSQPSSPVTAQSDIVPPASGVLVPSPGILLHIHTTYYSTIWQRQFEYTHVVSTTFASPISGQSEGISLCRNPEWMLPGSRKLATISLFHWIHRRRLNFIPLDYCTLDSGHGNYGLYMDCIRRPMKNGPATVEQLYPERVLTCHSSSFATVTIHSHFETRSTILHIPY